jgi:DNA-binding SARP family transcriptional activator/energy-coupling factor transporter ATP-binding protein EcfA2
VLEVRLLGPLEVRRQGEPVLLGARMERALLAVLVLEAGRVVPADRIVDLLWGDYPPPKAVPALHTKVAHLRRALQPDRAPRAGESVLVTEAPGYRLQRDALALDAERFEALVTRAGAAAERDPRATVALAEEALGLWRGPALGEFADEPFARATAQRWETLRLTAVELHAGALLGLGDVSRTVAELSPHVARHPLREQARSLLVRALYLSGQQAAALEVLSDGRRLLRDELGLDPGPELQRLERQILEHDPALQPPARPVTPALRDGPVLHGRDGELGALLGRVEGAAAGAGSVVLLTGEGGMGKSALLELLAAAVDRRGGTTRWATCRDGTAAPPYWPVLQVVREAASEADEEARNRFARTLGPLRDLFPDLAREGTPSAGGVDPAMVLVHLTAALEQALAPAGGGVALLVLDDVHLADPASLALVGALAGRVHRARTVLALSLRTGESDCPALVDVLASLARLPASCGSTSSRWLPTWWAGWCARSPPRPAATSAGTSSKRSSAAPRATRSSPWSSPGSRWPSRPRPARPDPSAAAPSVVSPRPSSTCSASGCSGCPLPHRRCWWRRPWPAAPWRPRTSPPPAARPSTTR